MADYIKKGDKINVFWENAPAEFNVEVVDLPTEVGECWILKRPDGILINVLMYSKMEQVIPDNKLYSKLNIENKRRGVNIILQVLRYCNKMGWKTRLHKIYKAWALSYDDKATKSWVYSIGLTPIDNGIKITMSDGYCKTFYSFEAIKNKLEYMMLSEQQLKEIGWKPYEEIK